MTEPERRLMPPLQPRNQDLGPTPGELVLNVIRVNVIRALELGATPAEVEREVALSIAHFEGESP